MTAVVKILLPKRSTKVQTADVTATCRRPVPDVFVPVPVPLLEI